jgi:hypothetical protein
VGILHRMTPAFAQERDFIPSASDFGGVGLMQTRTARFGPDGQLDIGFSKIDPYERYLITIQALPWLEATFRYTSVSDRDFQGNRNDGVGTSFKDRGADLKFKLVPEGRFRPQVALGLQDGLGTGLFSGEYIALSKRYFDLDFTLGMGWGYAAGAGTIKNPFRSISDTFRTRDGEVGQGGSLPIGNYFRGETVGIFGGVEYTTPIRGVVLKMEYDPNDYENEPLRSEIVASSHWNFGLNYRPFSWIDLSLAYERGEAVMARFSLRTDLNDEGVPKFDPPAPPVQVRPVGTHSINPGAHFVATDNSDEEAADLDSAQAELALQGRGYSPTSVFHEGGDAIVMFDGMINARVAEDVARVTAGSGNKSIARVVVVGADGRTEIVDIPGRTGPNNIDRLFAEIEAAGGRMESLDVIAGRPRVTLSRGVTPSAGNRIARAVFSALPDAGPVVEISDASSGFAQEFQRDPPPVDKARSDRRQVFLAVMTGEQRSAAAQSIIAALEAERFLVDAVDLQPTAVTVHLSPRRFRQPARNIGRAAVAIANSAPLGVEDMTLVLMSAGLETGRVTVRRADIEAAQLYSGSPEEIWAKASITGPLATGISPTAYYNPDRYPFFSYSFRPQVRQHVGGGDQFFLYQLWAALTANAQVTDNWSFTTTLGKDIYNNFDKIRTEPQRNLPPVRSDIKKYLQEGEDNIVRLQANGLWTLGPDLYGRISTGLFEEMYGGVGAEILYRPFGSRFAVGADLNRVRQRDYDQRFSFLDYEVTTGHLNLYYQFPIYDLLGLMSVGRYLAGDKGATFQLSRRFESGIQAGVFFTLTDVPFEVFGEGSFDKGFFFTIPFDVFSTRSSTAGGTFGFRPLTKDGGQKLNVGPRLYDVTSGGSLNSIARDWGKILE